MSRRPSLSASKSATPDPVASMMYSFVGPPDTWRNAPMPEAVVASAYVTPGAALGDDGGTWIVGGGVCADTATTSAAATGESRQTGPLIAAPPCAGAVRGRTPPGRVLRCRPCGAPGQARNTLRPSRAR